MMMAERASKGVRLRREHEKRCHFECFDAAFFSAFFLARPAFSIQHFEGVGHVEKMTLWGRKEQKRRSTVRWRPRRRQHEKRTQKRRSPSTTTALSTSTSTSTKKFSTGASPSSSRRARTPWRPRGASTPRWET